MRSPKTHDWSELLCRVHKQGCQGLGAIEMHSRARASGASSMRFDRPARQATEPRAKRKAMPALCHGLVVDSTFERSENVAVSLSSYSWPAVRVWSSSAHARCTNWHSIVH